MGWRGSGGDLAFLRETEVALLNAPFVDDGWRIAIDMVARATGSRGANLVCLGSAAPTLNLFTGFDAGEVERALSDPAMWGPQNWRVGTSTKPYEIQHDLHYRDYRAGRPRSDYDEAAYELDMPHGFQTIFSRDVAGFIGLAVIRGRREGPADPQSVERFERLSWVLGRALKAEMAMAGEGIRTALVDIDETPGALILLNRHGWACGFSRAAEALLSTGDPLRLRGASVAASNSFDDARLQQLLGFLLYRDVPPGGSVTVRLRGAGGSCWTVQCTHLPRTLLALGFEPQVALRIEPAHGSGTLDD
jgi:hypothetical protein